MPRSRSSASRQPRPTVLKASGWPSRSPSPASRSAASADGPTHPWRKSTMSYPSNPPEGAYPPPGGPQPGQGEQAYQPGSPYQPATTPYSSPPAGNQFPSPGPEEQQPSSPYAAGQPTAAMPTVGGYPETQPSAPPAYQPEIGRAHV